jgi:hypothetical protein
LTLSITFGRSVFDALKSLLTPGEQLVSRILENGRNSGVAQQMAGHESPRTTKLYDRTKDEI